MNKSPSKEFSYKQVTVQLQTSHPAESSASHSVENSATNKLPVEGSATNKSYNREFGYKNSHCGVQLQISHPVGGSATNIPPL